MLEDLLRLLWRMENLPMYWGIGMAIIIGAVWITGVVLFATADQRHRDIDHASIGLGAGALTILVAMLYSPFLNRWFDSPFEAKRLREVLYSQQLEEIASYMHECRMRGRDKIADDLLRIWEKYTLEPGLGARPIQ